MVLKVDEAITLKRPGATAWLTAHGHALPSLPIKPTRMELAVVIALAKTYGAAIDREARFVPVISFIADDGAVALVQRVMYGPRPETDFDVTASTAENTRLAATWPKVFLVQTNAVLAGIGMRVRAPDAEPIPLMSHGEDGGRGGTENDRDDGDDHEGDDDSESEEGGHA